MAELILEAGDDHVARLAHENDPVRAVVELIWNAIDAESTKVVVSLDHDEWGAISKATVTDDGHGIDVDEIKQTFGRIGGSWKRLATRTKNGKRALHGKLGEGRLRAFALGSRVQWVSVSRDTAGKLHQVEISGSTDRRHAFPWESQEVADVPTGTLVTALNESQKSLVALEAENTLTLLLSHFAPVLLNDEELAITYDGSSLDPADEIDATTDIGLTFGEEGQQHAAKIRIIEWKSGKHRVIHFQTGWPGDV